MEKVHGKITVTGKPVAVIFCLKEKRVMFMQDVLAVILIILCIVIVLLFTFIFFSFIGLSLAIKDIVTGWR